MAKKATELGEKKPYEKQVLRFGKWKHAAAPNGILEITKEYAQKIADNFSSNPFVPVYRGHASDDEAAKNPSLIVTKNIKGFKLKDDGLYADIDINEDEVETYADVSLSIQDDYEDHESGKILGPVARHIALVPSPYIKGLNPFVALKEKNEFNILLSEINMAEEKKPSEVEEAKVEETPAVESVEAKPTEEKIAEPVVEPAKTEEAPKEEIPEEPKVEPVETIDNAESSEKIRVELEELRKERDELRQKVTKQNAETMYAKFLSEGKVLPTFKSEFISLASVESKTINLSDGKETPVVSLIEEIFKKMPTLINLKERGINPDESSSDLGIPVELMESMEKTFKVKNPDGTKEDFAEYLRKNEKEIKEYLPKK